MNLTEISLKRPVTIFMFFTCVTLIGAIGVQRLQLELLPDIEFPGLVVGVPYRNSTPEEVERHITRPVEEALATLSGIEHIYSTSRDDGADIRIQFHIGEDMAVKGVEARDKIDAIRATLPADIERINIAKDSNSNFPIQNFRISADRDLSDAYDMLERNLKRRIERLPGVSKVELQGVEKKEIRIELAADRIATHGVSLPQLAENLRKANFEMAAGDLIEAGKKYYVKPEGRFRTIADVENFTIGPNGLKIRDIADVRFTLPRVTYERHLNQRLAVGFAIYKENGANLVEVSDRVAEEVASAKSLPEMAGLRMVLIDDQASAVRASLKGLIEAGALGAAFSVAVLFLFLRDWRTTLIVALSVPLSLLMTLAALYFLGYSINVLTLMGLMLSIGMLVDNAVVVNEAIFKARADHPLDALKATLQGTNSVGLAVTLGTLCTGIVFLPNLFGAQDEITLYLSHVAITICIALAASLLVAITLIPQLTTRIPTAVGAPPRWMKWITERYIRVLAWTEDNRGKTGLFCLIALLSVAIPMTFIKKEMFGQEASSRMYLNYHFNSAYPLDTVRESVNRVEGWLMAHKDQLELENAYTYFDIERGFTLLYLKDKSVRKRDPKDIMEDIRKGLPKIPIGEPSFDDNRGGGKALSVNIYGESSEHLHEVTNQVVALLRQTAGLTDVAPNVSTGGWEMRVKVDRDKARLYGLSSQQVAEVVQGAMRGTSLRPYRTPTGEVEMVLQLRREDRTSIDALRSLPLLTPDGRRIALDAVAELSIGDVPGDIKREDRRTSLAINFSTANGTTADDARKKVEQVLNSLQFPPGYGWGYGQAFNDDDKAQQTMLLNMLLALACIYLVMAALFESVLAPSAIITGIFFSFVGVFWLFMFTDTTFSFMAMIGMLVLMGVVVNNGIVLIDHVHQLREAGMSREAALLQGSRDRLRPILMTASSTVLAMIPLAVGDTTLGGEGFPPYYPMARAIIGGLSFATLVSLIVLPTIYLALDDVGHWGRRIVAKARGVKIPPAPGDEMAALK